MDEIAERFILDCKNKGETFVSLYYTPREFIEELVRRREAAITKRLATIASGWKMRIECSYIDISEGKELACVKERIGQIREPWDNNNWIPLSEDVLDKALDIEHLQTLKEIAAACLHNEAARVGQVLAWLRGDSVQDDKLWNIEPVIDAATAVMVEGLSPDSAVVNMEKLEVAFFD